MLVSDVTNRVRVIAGDTSSLQFTDAQLLDWINDGVRECALLNNLLQKRATNATVVGDGDYALPTDILKLHSVKVDGRKLDILTLEEFQKWVANPMSTTTGTVDIAYIWANIIQLFPIPNSIVPLIIDYTYTPAAVTVPGDAIPLPVGYHQRIVDYCLAKVAEQDDDLNKYNTKMLEFQTGVRQLKDQNEYSEDLYPSLSMSVRDMGDGSDG